jgi:ABC-2 type transport system ATP-binding protein
MEVALDPSAPPLEIHNVSAAYGKKSVLSGISFALDRGEVFGLVGLNGAGKTTLIRSILGLRRAAGEIRLFGKANSIPAARRNLIYLPEKFQPPPQLKGVEYLSILLDYFGQKFDGIAARTIAARLDLDPTALDRKVRTYSKGMGQKLGLLGSLLVSAPLMILDEPMSGLDPRARVMLKDRLTDARSNGRTIFFSSHILSDIEEICDRLCIIHGGQMVFIGTPAEFMSQNAGISLERAFLASLERTERAADLRGARLS